MSQEVELKLALPPQNNETPTDIAWLENTESRHQRLGNTYYDTPDGALERARVALRIRRTDAGHVQTLKTAGDANSGLTVRGEWEWPIEGDDLDRSGLAALPPFRTLGASVLDALTPRFTTDFERTTWQLEHDGSRIEMAWDKGEIQTGDRHLPIHEIELELKSGDPGALWEVADRLARTVTLRPAAASKAARGASLLAGAWSLPTCLDTPSDKFAFTIAALDAARDSGQTGFQAQARAILAELAESETPPMTPMARQLAASLAAAMQDIHWWNHETGRTALSLSRALYETPC
ncbi:CYTH domain-containing protein [Aidingimonas halophila]|uniref:CYTH domain-containing protein n=1 Tax=Aidingimonas halophila TaxID=574349 RepID=A0A1H2V6B0_9GAMM|nr:CYTH domain-containing protein [Aidingimonas halophila]GHC23834.1 hypothetical protein GCM10008094_13380 [Aidingimonas halophila]SDW63825.1 CYTH domain-containing protein [Aidingimonas halophila]